MNTSVGQKINNGIGDKGFWMQLRTTFLMSTEKLTVQPKDVNKSLKNIM